MALTLKEKELVAVGASVASGCKSCTNYHLKNVREAGALGEDIQHTISDVMCVRNNAAIIMERHALKHFEITTEHEECDCGETTTRITGLISIAAAFAVNCPSSLEKHLAVAQRIGITNDDIKAVLELTVFIKKKAASHVDRIAEHIKNAVSSEENTGNPGGCGCNDETETVTSNESMKESAATAAGDCGCSGDC